MEAMLADRSPCLASLATFLPVAVLLLFELSCSRELSPVFPSLSFSLFRLFTVLLRHFPYFWALPRPRALPPSLPASERVAWSASEPDAANLRLHATT